MNTRITNEADNGFRTSEETTNNLRLMATAGEHSNGFLKNDSITNAA